MSIKEGDIVKEGMVFAYMEADKAQKNENIEKDKTVQENLLVQNRLQKKKFFSSRNKCWSSSKVCKRT